VGRIMRQNLGLSGLIIGTLIPLATLGILGLATVVATHELAEIVVIANGGRAGRRAADGAPGVSAGGRPVRHRRAGQPSSGGSRRSDRG
jgi:cation-transporting ATPase G